MAGIAIVKFSDGLATVTKPTSPSLMHSSCCLLQFKSIRHNLLAIAVVWFSVHLASFTLTSYLSFNTRSLPWQTFFLSSAELLSFWMAACAVRRLGRVNISVFLAAVGGFAILMSLAFFARHCSQSCRSLGALQLVFVYCGLMCVVTLRNFLFIYTAELFPTSVRSSTLGVCSALGAAGAMLALMLESLTSSLFMHPFGFAVAALAVASVVCCVLPETSLKPLQDYLDEDREAIGELCPTKD
jgi:hypothetical protein